MAAQQSIEDRVDQMVEALSARAGPHAKEEAAAHRYFLLFNRWYYHGRKHADRIPMMEAKAEYYDLRDARYRAEGKEPPRDPIPAQKRVVI